MIKKSWQLFFSRAIFCARWAQFTKSEKYYRDLYDLFTIKECLRLEKQFSSPLKLGKKVEL
jgi:hypothetical protein